jgi:hypothetical protein
MPLARAVSASPTALAKNRLRPLTGSSHPAFTATSSEPPKINSSPQESSTPTTVNPTKTIMKNQIASFTALAALAFALPLASTAQAFQPTTTGGGYIGQAETVLLAKAPTYIAATGTFVAAEQPTAGSARIVVENGQRYLVLDGNFKTSNQGPDLHVVLDPAQQPPLHYQDKANMVNLGKLQKFAGEQRYAIPANIDLAKFKSVGIWCQMANATFGYAPLNPAPMASR